MHRGNEAREFRLVPLAHMPDRFGATKGQLLIVALGIVLGSTPALGQCGGRFIPFSQPNSLFDGFVPALAKWDPDGPGPARPVLVCGGSFNRIGGLGPEGATAASIATWDGASFSPIGNGFSGGSENVLTMAVYQGDLYVAGRFRFSGSQALGGIARWDGTSWQAVGGGLGLAGAITTFVPFGGELVALGSFTSIGGVALPRSAKWNGQRWATFGTNVGEISCATVLNDQLYIGLPGTTPEPRVRRFNDGTWISLPSGGWSLGLLALGSVDNEIVGTGLVSVGFNQFAYRVKRTDGTIWSDMSTGAGEIRAFLNAPSGLYAGGGYRLRRFNGVGWDLVAETQERAIYAIEQFGPEFILGGKDTRFTGSVPGVARWSPDGIPWVARSPQPQQVLAGVQATFRITPSPGYDFAGPLTYRWHRNGVPLTDRVGSDGTSTITGADTAALTIAGARVWDEGDYSCSVTSPCGTSSSDPASLTVLHDCPPDCNGDGIVNCDDLADFVNAYFGAEPRPPFVNFNGDDDVNADDLGDFINVFFARCP